MVWSSTGVVGIICRVLFIAKNITAAIFQYLCVIKIFFPTLGQPNTLWPSNQIIKSVKNRLTNWSFKVNIQPLQSKKKSVDASISDHSLGRSEGFTGQTVTHYNRMNSSPSAHSSFSSSFFWKSYSFSYFSPLLSVKTRQKCGTLGCSVFPLSHGFPLTSLKFYPADYNTVKET